VRASAVDLGDAVVAFEAEGRQPLLFARLEDVVVGLGLSLEILEVLAVGVGLGAQLIFGLFEQIAVGRGIG